ncbi:saccharopine dehydrogenase [Thermococcus profundus]|uniref:Saccharopine dehydrogenase n=1 Tax=Thermococcus profundus TaxID=49899 RepID=A0A2Z2MBW0_THEPR|nr:saccharopine dehydrogenase family protein [Thermococcus profundus]ASJ02969.1 saccharopine dehydrogenase [Thermococcus profundus]
MRVLVLGGGNIGRVVAWDLREDFEVYVGDADPEKLKSVEEFAEPLKIDASNFAELVKTMEKFDLVVGALPGRFGFSTVKAAIEAGVDLVDVSFMPENPLQLHSKAEEAQVTVVFDAGFAPGLSNVLMGRIYQELDELDEGIIYVGGLPKDPRPPLYYRITWSPKDLIEEYVRKARVLRNGEVAALDPLGEIRHMNINGMEFEAFLSDGLRSLLESIRAKKLEEWTLRWPGHLERMKVLRELGFFKPEHVEATLRVITPLMTYESPDFSIMEVVGRGTLNEEEKEIRYLLYDEEREFTSMARVTGFTTSIVARMVAEKTCTFGVIPPEIIGMREDTYEVLINGLKERGINLRRWEVASPDNS